jgi:hypothetical protein
MNKKISERDSEKKFQIQSANIKDLVAGLGSCIASNLILMQGRKVGYMYREKPDHDVDSGWRFFAGDESEAYTKNAENFGLYDVNTVANYDPEIVPYLSSPPVVAFIRVPGSASFEQEDGPNDPDV